MKKKIFICGGFIDEQLLWMLPIICSYSKKKKITKILFEKKINFNKFPKHILELLKEFEISYIENVSIFQKKLLLIFYILKNFNIFFYILFNLNKKKLLSPDLDWTMTQYLHGTWDEINLKKKDFLNLNIKFRAIIDGIYQMEFGKKLIKQDVKFFFLSHTVYSKRWLLAYLRKFDVEIFNQSFTNIHKQKKNKDTHWTDIKKKIIYSLGKKQKKVENYWKKRKQGKGNYSATNQSILNVKKNFNSIKNKNYNLVLLHIFRDSPFYKIDRNRIFVDYFDWFENTLEILRKSNEIIIIKMHPIYKRWGEDQPLIVKKIIKKVFKSSLPKNFKIINSYPKNELFMNAKRIITYSGTSAIEAIAYSKKPIVICKTTIEEFEKDAVFRPSSLKEYKNLLLKEKTAVITGPAKGKIEFTNGEVEASIKRAIHDAAVATDALSHCPLTARPIAFVKSSADTGSIGKLCTAARNSLSTR